MSVEFSNFKIDNSGFESMVEVTVKVSLPKSLFDGSGTHKLSGRIYEEIPKVLGDEIINFLGVNTKNPL